MAADPDRQAMANALTRTAGRDRVAEEALCAERESRRAAVLARYGTAANALAPCLRERDLSHSLWRLIVPGTLETGPSLMGWRGAPGEALPASVRQAVSAAIPAPATAEAAWAEHHHWAERAEVHALLDGPGLPLWVRARQAFLEARLDTLFAMLLADPEAHAAWRRLSEGGTELAKPEIPPRAASTEEVAPIVAPATETPQVEVAASPAPADVPAGSKGRPEGEVSAGSGESLPAEQVSHSPDPGSGTDAAQPGQPKRTRKEAQAAVRALLGEPLTDREIARRVGVSPTTVAAVRKAVAGGDEHADQDR